MRIKMYSPKLLGWIIIAIYKPKLQFELLELLKREESIPLYDREIRDKGLIEEKEEA